MCFCSALPPDVLKSIAKNARGRLRDAAVQSLETTANLIAKRSIRGIMPQLDRSLELTAITGQLCRKIMDAKHVQLAAGAVVRSENDSPIADQDANRAYDGAGFVYKFLKEVLGRNSFDNMGAPLTGVVHYGTMYDNAFWDGRQMVYGDGDGVLFNSFTSDQTILTHEHIHGLTQNICNLSYEHESGALNESISDVFASAADQWAKGQSFADADWIIGRSIVKRVKGVGVRSLKAPGTAYDDPLIGKDKQPAVYSQFVHTADDSGGVHTNSGIPNHAFYLTCSALPDIKSWADPLLIWYRAMTTVFKPIMSFADAAAAFTTVASEIFGPASKQCIAVRDAWHAVEVN